MQSDIMQRLREYRSRDDWGDLMRHEICDEAAAEIARLTEAMRAAEERVKALREVLAEISGLHGEINPCNYDNDDACELNRQFCYALTISSAALKDQPHADA